MNATKVNVESPTEFPFVVTRGNSTVKIFRVNSPKNRDKCYYQVADYSQGKRRLISKAKFSEARAEAERIVKCLAAGEVHALELRGPERASFGRAIELLKPTGTPLELAAARYAEAVKIIGDGAKLAEAARFFALRHPVSGNKSVSELIKEMLKVKDARGRSDRYLEDLESRLSRFQEAFPGNVGDIDTRSVQKWLDGLRRATGEPISSQSYVNYRTVVKGLFSFAEARGYIAKGTNPVADVERPKAKRGTPAIFTPSEFSALLHASRTDFLPVLAIGGFAGLRSAEIQRLAWSDIDLVAGTITVSAENSKTASRRSFQFCEALSQWLAPYSGATGMLWTDNADAFVNTQRSTAKRAGVKWKSNALRHSYASYRLAESKNAATTAYELGHSGAVLDRHYKELVKPSDAAAWFAIRPSAPANVTLLPVVGE